ncbi:tetratricopeptide repeat protein [Nocardia brevicatena]|uniref:tetratricopeptide repeat protein n=1 Tax=Nocardia brevicatena TaxID=37327 RepID=UPI0012F71A53|nr:hypothetical protein [Nocardia brevicatena]
MTSIQIGTEPIPGGTGCELSWVEALPACFGTTTSRDGALSPRTTLAEPPRTGETPAAESAARTSGGGSPGDAVEDRPAEPPLAARYRSAEPIDWRGTPVYPMYAEQLPGTTAELTMILLSATPPTGLRGFGMGLSTVDGHIGFGHRYLTGVDVWQDALERGITFELTATARGALFTLTPVWMVEDGRPCSWTGNYGIVVERTEPGRTVLWCSMGEGPPNFTDLVVEVRMVPTDAPTAPQPPFTALALDADTASEHGFDHPIPRGPIPVVSTPADREPASAPAPTEYARIDPAVPPARNAADNARRGAGDGPGDDTVPATGNHPGDDRLAITAPLDYDPRELGARSNEFDEPRPAGRDPRHLLDEMSRHDDVRDSYGEHGDTPRLHRNDTGRDESTGCSITDDIRNPRTEPRPKSPAPAPEEPAPISDGPSTADTPRIPPADIRRPADPAYRRALYGLGVAMYGLGDDERARMLWARAASAGHAGAAYDLGVLHVRRGEFEEAERWWRTASNRRVVRAMTDLAELLEHRGEHGEARLWRTQAAAEHAIAAGYRRSPIPSDTTVSAASRADHQRLPAVGGTAARKM